MKLLYFLKTAVWNTQAFLSDSGNWHIFSKQVTLSEFFSLHPQYSAMEYSLILFSISVLLNKENNVKTRQNEANGIRIIQVECMRGSSRGSNSFLQVCADRVGEIKQARWKGGVGQVEVVRREWYWGEFQVQGEIRLSWTQNFKMLANMSSSSNSLFLEHCFYHWLNWSTDFLL